MGSLSRTMLNPYDKLLMLRALRGHIEKMTTGKDLQGWNEAQHAYRMAEALAHPKRGARAHKVAGYEWYFENNRDAPLRQLDEWIKQAHEALDAARAPAPDAPGTPLPAVAAPQ